MAARFLRTCRSKVRTSKYHSEGSTPPLPVGFEFRAAWHRPARVSRAPSKEGARKGEGKLRRSCAHPRAGASRRRARPAPVPDWPVVPSRASRWPPSSLSSPRCSGSPIPSSRWASHGAPCPLASPPFFLSAHLSDTYPVASSRRTRRSSRGTPEIGGGKISRRADNATRGDFPLRERLKLRESGSLGARESSRYSIACFPPLVYRLCLSFSLDPPRLFITSFSYRFSAGSPPRAIRRHLSVSLDFFSSRLVVEKVN